MGAMQAVELEPESGRSAVGEEPSAVEEVGPNSPGGEVWDVRFAALAEEYSRLLFRVAYGLLRNQHDAEDAVQEALLRIYRTGLRNDQGVEIADEKAYLARTVWRAGLDIAARRPKGTEPIEAHDDRRELVASGRSAEDELAEGDERALIRHLIDSLPDTLRLPLVLSATEEMTSREVAAAMEIPEGTVRTRVMRARAELRKRFETIRARTKTAAGSQG